MTAAQPRAQASCEACGESVDVPDTPFGRGMVAAFERVHSGHDAKEGKR